MISKEDFLETFQSIFDDTPADQVSLSTPFKELEEWSSLHVLSLIVVIEQKFSLLLTAKQIDAANTVEDIYNHLS